jgi:hypothetical protein
MVPSLELQGLAPVPLYKGNTMAVKRCQNPDHKGSNLLEFEDFSWADDDPGHKKPYCMACTGDGKLPPPPMKVEVNTGEDKKDGRAKSGDKSSGTK